MTSEPILVADLDRARPASALGDSFGPGQWRVLPYVADGIDSGRMLGAGDASRAAEISVPIERTGWHRVSVGFFNGFWRPYREQRLEIRRSSDTTWSTLYLPAPSALAWNVPLDDDEVGPSITEVPWRTLDLTE
jgi:hypothetical protein